MSSEYYIGQRLSVSGSLCTIRYVGQVERSSGEWLGVEWDDPTRGIHSGGRRGKSYFSCHVQGAGSFIRGSRTFEKPVAFLEAVQQKYASDALAQADAPIEISGKTAEEIGFERVRRVQAVLDQLRVVLVDGLRVAGITPRPYPPHDHFEGQEAIDYYKANMDLYDKVAVVCPKIEELDLSKNMIELWTDVACICLHLPRLRILKVSGNRFRDLSTSFIDSAKLAEVFKGLREIFFDGTLLRWDQIVFLTTPMYDLTSLSLASNGLHTIPISLPTKNLTTLNLAANNIATLSDLQPLTSLAYLTVLSLSSNHIATTCTHDRSPPCFQNLLILDLSVNLIASWKFISKLPEVAPELTSLRISGNPVFDGLNLEESYMLTLARISKLKTLNHSTITPGERTNAELYYLSQVGKQLSTATLGTVEEILKEHPRYKELCDIHGAPSLDRSAYEEHLTENTLAARLIEITFFHRDGTEKHRKIPRSVNTYTLKSVVGKLFDVKPMHLRLIHETDEFDPVQETTNEDDKWEVEGDDEDSEDVVMEGTGTRAAIMVRREVEIVDGTRTLGQWVDGTEARMRVEKRDLPYERT